MTTLLIIIGTAIMVFIMLYVFAPLKYELFRTVIVEKPMEEVFPFICHLSHQNVWAPWACKDIDMKRVNKGKDGEIGFVTAWSGSKKYGDGEQEITNIIPNRVIETQLRFLKPFKFTSDAYMRVYEKGDYTEVLWGFKGVYKRPINILMFFIGLDTKLGRELEAGLNKLKHYIEA